MSKQKVRQMVDKDLRDEIVGHLGGAGSFNEALRWYIKGSKQLVAESKEWTEEREEKWEMESDLMLTKLELQASKSHSMNIAAKNQEIKNQLKRDYEELHRLNKINFELSTALEGTDKAYKALLELYMDKRGSRLTYLRWGVVFGLLAGLAIGYLFL